jgi:hypothetical protein
LLTRNEAKSSGFSFNEIYLSASGWTNVPWSENNLRIDFIASPTKIFQYRVYVLVFLVLWSGYYFLVSVVKHGLNM